jgi:hypothetical protein
MKCINIIEQNQKSVKFIHSCYSAIQKSYDIVKVHGGNITVDSNTVTGTTFTITS